MLMYLSSGLSTDVFPNKTNVQAYNNYMAAFESG